MFMSCFHRATYYKLDTSVCHGCLTIFPVGIDRGGIATSRVCSQTRPSASTVSTTMTSANSCLVAVVPGTYSVISVVGLYTTVAHVSPPPASFASNPNVANIRILCNRTSSATLTSSSVFIPKLAEIALDSTRDMVHIGILRTTLPSSTGNTSLKAVVAAEILNCVEHIAIMMIRCYSCLR